MTSTLALLFATLFMHPVHETVSEVEWNDKSNRLEIAIRLSVLDEQWIQREHAKSDDQSKWAIAYLQSTFLADPQPKTKRDAAAKPKHKYHWIGRDQDGSHVWWYFEIEPRDRQRPKRLELRMMFEREESFANRILVLDRVPRLAATLTIQQPILNLDKATDEDSERHDESKTHRRSGLDR